MTLQRTDWAEEVAARLCSDRLLSENVFRGPMYLDGTEKELCDLLLFLRGEAILVSMKAQQDPTLRDSDRLERWVLKKSEEALNQVRGALRTLERTAFWAQHPSRGRVDFAQGSVSIRHAVILVEHFAESVQLPETIPLVVGNVEISYFTVNDFLNVVHELVTYPDILAYLNCRRTLPMVIRRRTGGEPARLGHYLVELHTAGHFSAWPPIEVLERINKDQPDIVEAVKHRRRLRRLGLRVEAVASLVSNRMLDYARDLPEELVRGFDPPHDRKNYLIIQENLCDLTLEDRAALGALSAKVWRTMKQGPPEQGPAAAVGVLEGKPDFVYVVVAASSNETRATIIRESRDNLRHTLQELGKDNGMLIVDMDGHHFEIVMQMRREIA